MLKLTETKKDTMKICIMELCNDYGVEPVLNMVHEVQRDLLDLALIDEEDIVE